MIHFQKPEENLTLVGYAALIDTYRLQVPLPKMLCAISVKHKKYISAGWRIFTPRHQPMAGFYGNLVFALRYEGLDLYILKVFFEALSSAKTEELTQAIILEPHGQYAKRIWFLYEYLLEKKLDIPDLEAGRFVELVDTKLQYAAMNRASRRHHIYNNLPGVKDFCPLIHRTELLDMWGDKEISVEILKNIGDVSKDVLNRASAFLLLEDSKASYVIEGETPPHHRIQRWGAILAKAGQETLSKELLLHLQQEVIIDQRFVQMGWRQEGGFIGVHDRITHMPIPSHISAQYQDLPRLMDALIETAALLKESRFPPILTAAVIAFGFVFIHPFEDGNGRIHRYLLHHMLADIPDMPPHLVFPISAVLLKHIDRYRTVLEGYSKPRLSLIAWRSTLKGNLEVMNETIDLYRFFDATQQAEFLCDCMIETIYDVFPQEIAYLQQYDRFKQFMHHYLEMPERVCALLINFLYQNGGKFSKRALQKEFSALTEQEQQVIEEKFNEIFP